MVKRQKRKACRSRATSRHHAHLSEMDIRLLRSQLQSDAALRNQRDRDALRRGLADGTIDALCSDHTPVRRGREAAAVSEAETRRDGSGAAASLTLKWAAESGVPLPDALAKVTIAPAKQSLRIDAGHLSIGAVADVCIFDPERYWKITRRP